MDVDQIMREFARKDKQKAERYISFTPELERSIRQLAYGSKRRQRFAPLFAGWSMAAVLAIIVALPWIGPANIRKVETKPPSAEVSEQAVQAVLQRMYNALPELKAYKLETVSQTSILLRKDAAQTANIQFDQADREIEWFQINTVGQSAGQKPSMSLAKGRAADFLSKVLGGVSQQYRAMSAVDAAFGRQIMFQRYLHGLPVLWDTVEVVVNAEGKVVSYNGLDRLKDLPLFGAPDPTEAIGQKQAIQEMTSKMKLRYIENLPAASDPITGQAKTRILLEYSPGTIPYSEENRLTADWFIDAATGKLETMLGEPGQSFAFAPPKEYVKVKNAEDAARLIESVYQIKVNPQELKAGKSNRQDIQSLLYAPGTDHEIEIAFYKESGVIKALLTKQRQVERKVSEAEALKAAVRFLEKHADPGIAEVAVQRARVSGEEYNRGSYEFNFFKQHDGIPVFRAFQPTGAYTVYVDPATGQVNGFRRIFDPAAASVPYPSKEQAVSVEEAVQSYLAVSPLKLAYLYQRGEGEQQGKLRLVYVPYPYDEKNSAYHAVHIDATTGKEIGQ